MRGSGILLHISSLPSNYGIGTLGKEAYNFVDFLKEAGQSYWQILPIGPTSFGDSPYQSPSTYAGNPYFIDFELLCEDGILEEQDYERYDWGQDESKVDYEKIYESRFKVLRRAYENGFKRDYSKVSKFIDKNKHWVEDYALFMAIKGNFNMTAYTTWDLDIRLGKSKAIKDYKDELKNEINFYIYMQYLFYKQWNNLKKYANFNKINIIGDIPIYVAQDSVDTWSNPKIFDLSEEKIPINVAGCPPDAFTDDGQLWGNPVYNWEELKDQNYKWWMDRIKAATETYDVVRIDHFRGFASFYAITNGAENARKGKWLKANGSELFKKVKDEIPKAKIIAEDLGYLTEDVYKLMEQVGFPGMKILLFGFGNNGNSEFIPYRINKNSVSYIGTHDNDTFLGWLENANENEIELAKTYMNLTEEEGYNWGIIRTLYGTQSETTIVQMQDILGLDNRARMNLPSTVGGNWQWRLTREQCSKELAKKLYNLNKIFGRI